MEEENTQILEINLISAQSLKTPIANFRRLQTYALIWVESSNKLRTKIDHFGGENPTWNDKFLFRVSRKFISGDTSGVSVEIYAVGVLKDFLVGTVRLLLSSCFKGMVNSGISTATPAFTAVQIRRPSGRFQGVLNIGAAVYSGTDFSLLNGLAAVCFRDLMEEKESGRWRRRRLSRGGSKRSEQSSGGESCDFSDGTDSTTSSSSSVVSTALKDWNSVRTAVEMAGKKDLKSDGGGLLCGLVKQKKIQLCPFDQNSQFWTESFEKDP
ncbi:PREDICTED: uncharacterized protein LOC109240161 [Nicotiana attenuata]|uniref:C2 domain-containing protein n=1 Tax=Nicotiana attenuata TaxID=49451 RepID=A0A1J6IR99_NICAT|nr:PREDICTED: uncharacterized protein LOC109240161 [Nicotiana attenuata]OIT07374.1 hypothetical protein A4A49_33085 [Nicotiana attenuata]